MYRRIKGGQPERVTLGRYPDLSIEQARRKVAEVNAAIAAGKNPADFARAAKQEMTLDDLHNEYMTRCAAFNRRPDKPKANYRLYLSAWGKRKLSTIKHEEVDRLHKKIGRENGIVTANIALKLFSIRPSTNGVSGRVITPLTASRNFPSNPATASCRLTSYRDFSRP